MADHVRDEMQSPVIEWNASDRDRPLRTAISEQAPAVERELASRLRRSMKRLEGGVSLQAAPGDVGAEATASFAGASTPGEQAQSDTPAPVSAGSQHHANAPCSCASTSCKPAARPTPRRSAQPCRPSQTSTDSPVALLAAGLPSTQQVLHDTAVGRDRSPPAGFLERQETMTIGNLDRGATYDAFERPIEDGEWTIDDDALDSMVQRSNGYPFAVQLIGHETWKAAKNPGHIDLGDVDQGVRKAARRLTDHVFIPRWRKMSPTDRRYLTHAARLRNDAGTSSTAEISDAMYGTSTSASQNRSRLIGHHQVLEPAERGRVQFTIPGMADWTLRRSGDDDVERFDALNRDLGQDNTLGRKR